MEIGLLVVLGSEPFYFDNLATHFVAAGAAIWVSASAKPSRWPIFVPCTIIAGLALQHGIRFDEMASTVASAITFAVGIACWVLVPREFQTKPSLSEPVQ